MRALGQQPASPPTAQAPASVDADIPQQRSGTSLFTLTAAEQSNDATAVSAEELRAQLLGKTFYLRGGYLENKLHFDERGQLNGTSQKASFTLSMIDIERVKLDKHRVVLEGVRYGLHFLGALATEDQTQAFDKVRLTSKKKPVEIVIDREQVIKPKKQKPIKADRKAAEQLAAGKRQGTSSAQQAGAATMQIAVQSDRNGAATIVSQAQSNRALALALDRIFAGATDDRMIATLPDYWQRFYRAAAEHRDFRPADPAVLRQSETDEKARLLSVIEPASNAYAQENGVAGMAMYHVVVGPDGKAEEIAVGRPIGFGLDENAIQSIRDARFQPAMKNGRPVPVMVDLVVEFRIYSKRTALAAHPTEPAVTSSAQPVSPGPYSLNQAGTAVQPQ